MTVVTNSSRSVKIRLHGVDAPEKAQAYGQAAKQTLSDYVFGQRVVVKRQTVDQYGRLVAVVTPEGKSESANERQLREGMAWWYKQYAPSNTKFEQLQSEAKAAKRGLWKDENPTAPWDFRRGQVADSGLTVRSEPSIGNTALVSASLRAGRDATPTFDPDPQLTSEMKKRSFKTTVRLRVTVEPDGSHSEELIQGTGNVEIDALVIQTLKRWIWRPALKNGEKVRQVMTFSYRFVEP